MRACDHENTHGMARKSSIFSEAVREAQEYTWQTLNAGFRPGMGQHIPDRFFWAREAEDDEKTHED